MDAEAFQFSLAAGDVALHLFASNEAQTPFETAHQIMATGSLSEVAVADCQQLYTKLAQLHLWPGNLVEAEAVIGQAKEDPAPGSRPQPS